MFLGVYANHVGQWTPKGRAFVVRRWDRLIENWKVRNCHLDKLAVAYIAPPLTYIINGFIAKHSFPDAWRTARVSPIPKVASPVEFVQYRPIAILLVLSKIMNV